MRNTSIIIHRTIYQMAVATLVGSVFWTGLGVYGSLTKTDNVEIDSAMLEKLDPTIDEETINNIFVRRRVLEGVDLSILETQPTLEEIPEIAPQTESTESAEINEVAIPEATESVEPSPTP